MWIYVDQFVVSADANVANEFCFVRSWISLAGKFTNCPSNHNKRWANALREASGWNAMDRWQLASIPSCLYVIILALFVTFHHCGLPSFIR